MATKFSLNSYSNIFNKMKENIQGKTGINNWNSDSVIRSVIEPIGAELSRINNQTVAVLDSISLSSAIGSDLDDIGKTYGMDRLSIARAETDILDYNFYFYTKKANFGAINSGNNIIVKAGTQVSPSGAQGTVLRYIVKEDVVLDANSAIAYAGIRAVSVGELSNITSNVLTEHNCSNYAEAPAKSLYCSNRLPITNGRDLEGDENFRYRIYNKYGSDFTITENSIRLKSMKIPGIFGQRFVKNWFGYGKSAVFLFGGNKEINQSTVSRYQSQLNSSLGIYSNIVAMPGIRVYLDLDITVWINRDIEGAREIDLKNQVYSEASNYLISRIDEKSISLLSLINTVTENVKMLSGISNRNDRSKMIEAAYVRKGYGGSYSATSERLKLVQLTHTLEPNEFFTLGDINIKVERV